MAVFHHFSVWNIVHKLRHEKQLSWQHLSFDREDRSKLLLIQRKDSRNNGHNDCADCEASTPINREIIALTQENQIEISMLRDEIQNIRNDVDSKLSSLKKDIMDRISLFLSIQSKVQCVPDVRADGAYAHSDHVVPAPIMTSNQIQNDELAQNQSVSQWRESAEFPVLRQIGIVTYKNPADPDGGYIVSQQNMDTLNQFTDQLPPSIQLQIQWFLIYI